MKKAILILMGITVLSCSSSSSSSSNDPIDTTVPLISTIHIDSDSFSPGVNSNTNNSNTITTAQLINEGAAKKVTFTLRKPFVNIFQLEGIVVDVVYPVSQSSISGTYYVTSSEGGSINNYVSGNYFNSSSSYYFKSGSVSVTDLGNSNYKLIFNNVVVTNNPFGVGVLKSITGTYQGNFVNED